MYFSEAFSVNRHILDAYGAVDINLICDTPLFIDPMLIFNSPKPEYQELHRGIVKYLHFLYRKASEGKLSKGEIKNYFAFKEVKENWLGYSISGNEGAALGFDFAKFFASKIGFVCETHDISKSQHLEKSMLLMEGTGKDKISDFTANLIKGFLANYTEVFAKQYIDASLCDTFAVSRSGFNYETESFESDEYYLPYIINKKGRKEYILLTPCDILREDDNAICRKDLLRSYSRVRASIDNDILRAEVDNYIGIAIRNYEEECRQKNWKTSEKKYAAVEQAAFARALDLWPQLYDYYVKLRENDGDKIQELAQGERDRIFCAYIDRVCRFVDDFQERFHGIDEEQDSISEARERIKFFKNRIEYGGLYKNLYNDDEPIANEGTLQRMFKLVWCRTSYDVNAEVNNGTGPVDFKVSYGSRDSSLVEFKLASNSRLSRVFHQLASYAEANRTEKKLVVIFYFSCAEQEKVNHFIREYRLGDQVGVNIFVIDCRADNKQSASKL